MRINEFQFLALSKEVGQMEGIMHYLPPLEGREFKQYWQSTSYKIRRFKLVQNLLFYYRVDANEIEPLGVIVLENLQVMFENDNPNILFAFSLNGVDGKHILVCRCQEDVNKWVTELKRASYMELRMQHMIAYAKLSAIQRPKESPDGRLISQESEGFGIVLEKLIDL